MNLGASIFEELWFAEDDGDQAGRTAARSLAAKLAVLRGLKPFSGVATKLLGIMDKPDYSLREATGVIVQDPSLASSVMRIANSALFTGMTPSRSIEQSVVRLGVNVLKEVVLWATLAGFIRDAKGVGRVIRDHCAGTAAVARALAQEFVPKYTDGIFLCGLMHDVGKLLLIQSGEIPYERALDASRIFEPDRIHLDERLILGYDHAVLGGHVLRLWNIPEPIPKIVAWHHQPSRASGVEGISSYIAILRIADRIEPHLASQPDSYEQITSELARNADCQFLGITGNVLLDFWVKLYSARKDILDICSHR